MYNKAVLPKNVSNLSKHNRNVKNSFKTYLVNVQYCGLLREVNAGRW